MAKQKPVTTGRKQVAADKTARKQPDPKKVSGKELAPTSEADRALKAQCDAGLRMQKVALENGALILRGTDEARQRMCIAFGSEHREFQSYCLGQLIAILPDAGADGDYTLPINAAVAMLAAIAPKDEMEAMLAVQMVASNHMALLCTRRAKHAAHLPQFEANGNMANKFARTHAAQVEALSRLRRGGKQIVEHVHVNAGGQAVIAGTLNHTGGKG